MSVHQITNLLSVLTVIAQISSILILLSFFLKKPFEKLSKFVLKNALLLSFIVALTATLGSLYYSEIAHYTPCVLCWYQRILMYPQTIILGVAFYRKDKNIAIYSMALSLIGAIIAIYHYLLQVQAVHEIVPCSSGATFAVSCTSKPFMTFGYITIPMMALSAFILIIFLQIINFRNKKVLDK